MSEEIKVVCPACGIDIFAPKAALGQRGRCSSCKTLFVMSVAAPEAPVASDVPATPAPKASKSLRELGPPTVAGLLFGPLGSLAWRAVAETVGAFKRKRVKPRDHDREVLLDVRTLFRYAPMKLNRRLEKLQKHIRRDGTLSLEYSYIDDGWEDISYKFEVTVFATNEDSIGIKPSWSGWRLGAIRNSCRLVEEKEFFGWGEEWRMGHLVHSGRKVGYVFVGRAANVLVEFELSGVHFGTPEAFFAGVEDPFVEMTERLRSGVPVLWPPGYGEAVSNSGEEPDEDLMLFAAKNSDRDEANPRTKLDTENSAKDSSENTDELRSKAPRKRRRRRRR